MLTLLHYGVIIKLYGGDKMQIKLIGLRKELKISQKEMAILLGISQKTYCQKENGKTMTGIRSLNQRRIFNVQIFWNDTRLFLEYLRR